MGFLRSGAWVLLGGLVLVLTAPNRHKPEAAPPADVIVTNPAAAKRQLSQFLTYKTVGAADADNHVPPERREAFTAAHEHLRRSYPAIWSQLEVTTISHHSLLVFWKGSNASLKPGALLSHMDVVPADEDPETSKWTHPPFGGEIEAGYIYGRGAIDLKSNVIAILHAVNQLVTEGHRPQRSLYLAFGHDEELGGKYGAEKIVQHLLAQRVELEFVLDEGGVIIEDGLPPLTKAPLALVGTAEKGYSLVNVAATAPGGHSSMPPVDGSSVASTLARVITAIDASPPPVQLQPPMVEFFQALAEAAPVHSLKWLLKSARNSFVGWLLGKLMTLKPDTAALVRTTAAVTLINAGSARNVLPQTGNFTINFRHLPGHTPDQVVDYVRSLVPGKDRERVDVTRLDTQPLSHISPSASSPHFALLSRVIRETMGRPGAGIVVAPYLVVGGTDAKLYAPLSKHIYRFQPVGINRAAKELSRVHGTDERISEETFISQIRFFLHFINLLSGPIV